MQFSEEDVQDMLLHRDEVAEITRSSVRTVQRRIPRPGVVGDRPMYHIDEVIEAYCTGPLRREAANRLIFEAKRAIDRRVPSGD